MTRRAPINRDPIRAPAAQPPLFYRDGRALSAVERGIAPLPKTEPDDDLPPTTFAPLPVPKPHYSDMLPVLAIAAVVIAAFAFKLVIGGLIFTGFLAGALAKNR